MGSEVGCMCSLVLTLCAMIYNSFGWQLWFFFHCWRWWLCVTSSIAEEDSPFLCCVFSMYESMVGSVLFFLLLRYTYVFPPPFVFYLQSLGFSECFLFTTHTSLLSFSIFSFHLYVTWEPEGSQLHTQYFVMLFINVDVSITI